MGHHQQPREVAELKGAPAKNPQRYRTTVPKSGLPLGKGPEHMSDEARACWLELSELAIPGTMTGADRITLEVLSELLADFRDDPRKFPIGKYAPLIGSLARFGMSPSDRNKLGVDKPKDDENVFAALDD